jgi:uncharacterized protein (DUF433 family)
VTRTLIHPGTGIYLRSDAARLLRVSPTRLRRWVEGYTYRYQQSGRPASRRRRPPVVRRGLPIVDGSVALSFVELMELRVVKALIDEGVSLQAVRVVARVASEYFETDHPLASQRLYTDGSTVFAELLGDEREVPDLVELSRKRVNQVIAGRIFQPFLVEIDFNPETALAERWWPLGRRIPIVLDPEIAFGAPVIAGTAVRTSTLARMAGEESVAEAAYAYDLEQEQVRSAVEFEHQLAAA